MEANHQSEALFKAVLDTDIESVKGLLNNLNHTERYNLLKIQKECGSTAVHSAVEGGSPDIMQYILESVTEENIYSLLKMQNNEGNTAIHWAAIYSTETMKRIMDTVPYDLIYKLLTIPNTKGYTPLHRAANFGRLESVRCIVGFIEKDDPNKLLMMQCAEGNTAVHTAVERGYAEVIEYILSSISEGDAYGLLKIQNRKGLTAVHFAAHKDGIAALKGTMKCIVDSISPDDLLKLLMIKSETGQHTVVHLVAFTEMTKVMKCVLDYLIPEQLGIILDSRNVNDQTPLAIARKCGIREMLSCIDKYLQKAAGTYVEPTLQHSYKGFSEPVKSHTASLNPTDVGVSDESGYETESSASGYGTESSAASTQRSQSPNFSEAQSGLSTTKSASINRIPDTEQTDKEQQHKIAKLEASLSEEIKRRQEAEQQLVEVREKLTLKIADLTSQNTALENSLDEEHHKRGKTEQQVVEGEELLDYELDNVRNKEDSFKEDSDEEDDSALEEFLKSCAIENEYKPIPPHLIHLIYSQCRKLNLESVVVSQSTEDWKHLLVAVVNPENIDLKLDEVLEQDPDFKITVENIKDPPKLESDVGDGRLQVKQKIKSRGQISWLPEEHTSRCELIVKTGPTNRDNQQVKFAFYAVVPAHLVMTEKQKDRASEPCNKLKDMLEEIPKERLVPQRDVTQPHDGQPNDAQTDDRERAIELETAVIAKIRLEVDQLNSRVLHSIQIHNEREPKFVDLKHPPLFCYRQWFYQVQESRVVHLPQSGDPCPAARCSVELQKVVCHHIFSNDIALLPLEENDAVYLQRILETSVLPVERGKIFPFQQLSLQRLIKNKEFKIKVKNLEGTLRPSIGEYSTENDERAEQGSKQSGIHLTFKLNNDSDTLEKGDCGAIVYLVSREGVHRPIGMYIGKMYIPNDKPDYKAIVLFQALKDLEEDYPHHISRLTPLR